MMGCTTSAVHERTTQRPTHHSPPAASSPGQILPLRIAAAGPHRQTVIDVDSSISLNVSSKSSVISQELRKENDQARIQSGNEKAPDQKTSISKASDHKQTILSHAAWLESLQKGSNLDVRCLRGLWWSGRLEGRSGATLSIALLTSDASGKQTALNAISVRLDETDRVAAHNSKRDPVPAPFLRGQRVMAQLDDKTWSSGTIAGIIGGQVLVDFVQSSRWCSWRWNEVRLPREPVTTVDLDEVVEQKKITTSLSSASASATATATAIATASEVPKATVSPHVTTINDNDLRCIICFTTPLDPYELRCCGILICLGCFHSHASTSSQRSAARAASAALISPIVTLPMGSNTTAVYSRSPPPHFEAIDPRSPPPPQLYYDNALPYRPITQSPDSARSSSSASPGELNMRWERTASILGIAGASRPAGVSFASVAGVTTGTGAGSGSGSGVTVGTGAAGSGSGMTTAAAHPQAQAAASASASAAPSLRPIPAPQILAGPQCPGCRTALDTLPNGGIGPNAFVRKLISARQIQCPDKCGKTMLIGMGGSRLIAHLEECSLGNRPCPACKVLLPPSRLAQHIDSDCPDASTMCPGCGDYVIRRLMPAHFAVSEDDPDIICEGQTRCDFGCDERILTRERDLHHRICVRRAITCDICELRVLFKDLESHNLASATTHKQLLATLRSQLRSAQADLSALNVSKATASSSDHSQFEGTLRIQPTLHSLQPSGIVLGPQRNGAVLLPSPRAGVSEAKRVAQQDLPSSQIQRSGVDTKQPAVNRRGSLPLPMPSERPVSRSSFSTTLQQRRGSGPAIRTVSSSTTGGTGMSAAGALPSNAASPSHHPLPRSSSSAAATASTTVAATAAAAVSRL